MFIDVMGKPIIMIRHNLSQQSSGLQSQKIGERTTMRTNHSCATPYIEYIIASPGKKSWLAITHNKIQVKVHDLFIFGSMS